MNYLHKNLEFTTVEEGEKQLAEARSIRDTMGSQLYFGILSEDCYEISLKLEELRRQPKPTTEAQIGG